MLSAPVVLVALVGAWLLFSRQPAAGESALTPAERERIEQERNEAAAQLVPPPGTPGIARGAQLGGLIGGSLGAIPGIFLGAALGPIGLGAGVLVGWIMDHTGNDTLGVRVDFAKRMGFCGLEDTPGSGLSAFINHRPVSVCPGLFPLLRSLGRDDLVYEAQNVIGKQDDTANKDWMLRTARALIDAGYTVSS